MENSFNPRFELEGIVRRLKSRKSLKNQAGNMKVISVNAKTGKIASKINIYAKHRYYLVYSERVMKSTISNLEIENFTYSNSLSLKIDYQISCSQLNMEKLIENLFGGTGEFPKQKLESIIRKLIFEFQELKCDTMDSFFTNFFKLRGNLVNFIRKRILELTGLNIQLRIQPNEEEELETIQIVEKEKAIFVKDFDKELLLSYKIELEVDQEQRMNAILNHKSVNYLDQFVFKYLKTILSKEITLNDLLSEPNKVKRKLTEKLSSALEEKGRIVGHFSYSLSDDILEMDKEFHLSNFDVECKLKDSNIVITHDLLLKINNHSKFHNSGITNIEPWVKDKLNSITLNALFGKDYIDLILSFNDDSGNLKDHGIKEAMNKAADQIGFEVNQLISIPKVEPLELLSGFNLSVGKNENFSTRDSRIKVKLEVKVRGRIRDLTKIRKYISPNINIKDKLKEHILEELTRIIDHIEPERFYMRFKFAGENDKLSVEEQIRSEVKKMLQEEFFASEISVLPKTVHTNITQRFEALQNEFHSFILETFPMGEGGRGSKNTFKVKYQINSVDENGWHRFQSKQFETVEKTISQINELLLDSLKNTFSLLRGKEISYKSHIALQKVMKIANYQSNPLIKKTFGLVIEIVSITREATIIEEKRHKRIEKTLDTYEKRMILEEENSTKLINVRNSELDALIKQHEYYQNIPELADSEEAQLVKQKLDEYENQFEDESIQFEDNLMEEEEFSEEGIDDLISKFEANQTLDSGKKN